jgi:hypothetical protein
MQGVAALITANRAISGLVVLAEEAMALAPFNTVRSKSA